MRSLNGQDTLQREQKPQRNNILTSGQRFSVRLALATGATLTALMGVQTLALQEQFLYTDTTSSVTASQIITTDAEGNEVALVVNDSSTVIEATATAQPIEIVQPTAQPTTAAVVVTTSSQPRPSTRSSR